MADAAERDELAMRAKRKTDPTFDDEDQNLKKSPKLEAFHSDSRLAENCRETAVTNQKVRDFSRGPSVSDQGNGKVRAGLDVDSDNEEDDYEGDEDDSYEDDDDENSEANLKVDHKGKGIMKDSKGKGKLIEEFDEDSSSSGSELDDRDSELSDDPLAEVDLNNILPSRTRRRTIRPGLCIASDLKNEEDDSDA